MRLSDFEVILYGGSDIDAFDNNSYRYRILNLKEQLDSNGIKSKIITNLSSIIKMPNDVKKLLILHRIAWDAEVLSVIKFAKENSIPIIYDIDDYVFDPSVYQFIRAVEVYTDEQKNEYEQCLLSISRILEKPKSEIKCMSHPCGSYNNDTLQILKELGIELGFKQIMTIEPEKGMKKVNNSYLEIARF